jgi:predicted small metal-binding protein
MDIILGMSKTFTCQELGGICDKKFSGDTLEEIMQKGMQHMGSDEEHMKHIAGLEESTGLSKEKWMEKMQLEFDVKPEDQ